jgi:hypothetical protein
VCLEIFFSVDIDAWMAYRSNDPKQGHKLSALSDQGYARRVLLGSTDPYEERCGQAQ